MVYSYQTEVSQSGLFFTQAEKYGDGVFMRAKLSDGEPCSQWTDISWNKAAEDVRHMGAGFIENGISKGDCVALFSHNRPRWILTDQAVQGAGGIVVPIYPTSTDSQLTFILNDCSARAVIAGDRELLSQVLRVKDNVPSLKFIGCLTKISNISDAFVFDYNTLLDAGKNSSAAMDEFEKRRKEITRYDPAAIIYTSGTTGNPKGVVLNQLNFKSQTDILLSTPIPNKFLERDIHLESLCFLPLCHIMGRTTDYHAQLALGNTINFVENMKKIQENIFEVKPQIFFSIPRLYEKVYEAVHLYAKKLTGFKKKTFDWAMKSGNEAAEYMIEGKTLPLIVSLKFAISNILVYEPIRKVIGFDRLVSAASGGGALPRDIAKFFRSMNIIVTEGYGLTETTSAVAWNGPRFIEPLPDNWLYKKAFDWLVDTVIIMQMKGKTPFKSLKGFFKILVASRLILPRFIIKPGSVGSPCKDTQIKIAADGEVLVKGPQVFEKTNGYFNQKKKTDEIFTDDGFFKTGDIGEFDENGFLKITDRKKELIVTSGGKNIAPHPIEMALILDIYIDQACVIGDNKKFLSALIVPQFELLEKLAKEKNLTFTDHDSLVRIPEIIEFYDKIVETVNGNLARYEQIKKYKLLTSPFSEETGELTPTQKMKRKVIHQNFNREIDSLYG